MSFDIKLALHGLEADRLGFAFVRVSDQTMCWTCHVDTLPSKTSRAVSNYMLVCSCFVRDSLYQRDCEAMSLYRCDCHDDDDDDDADDDNDDDDHDGATCATTHAPHTTQASQTHGHTARGGERAL